MSLDLAEQKWQYLSQKERIIRDAYDTRLNHMQILAAPSQVRRQVDDVQKQFMPYGYDPLKICTHLFSSNTTK